ncbi:MAG: four helix bundle protein [Mariprofundaceae bacterium]|nr:four helix bundle protein [Mariprofundaceae bacterium]
MNPKLKQMPLWRDANRLLLLIEDAVRGFPRYHKYTLGSDLRKQAMNIVRLIARAVHDRESRSQHLKRLIFSIDDMKILIQLGKEVKAFQNFKVFQATAEIAVSLGRQSGGWQRRMRPEAGI